MKIQKLISNEQVSEYEIKLGTATLMRTNNAKDAFQYWENIKVDMPDTYIARDGIRIAYVTRSGLRVYPLI